jgi:hypothetical protein
MCSAARFASLSLTRRHMGPDRQPLTAFPQSPTRLLCSGRRRRFQPRPVMQTPGQVLPVAFPRRAAAVLLLPS